MDLVEAAYRGDLRLVKRLASKENVNQTDEKQYTPLMWAAFRDQTKVVSHLLSLGANINAQNLYGRTAVMLAAQNDSYHCLRLLAWQGADLQLKDRWSETINNFGDQTVVFPILLGVRGGYIIGEFFSSVVFAPQIVVQLIKDYFLEPDAHSAIYSSPLSPTSALKDSEDVGLDRTRHAFSYSTPSTTTTTGLLPAPSKQF